MRTLTLILIAAFAQACSSEEPASADAPTEAETVIVDPQTITAADPGLLAGIDETTIIEDVDERPDVDVFAVTVRAGESLGLYARWSGADLKALASHNVLGPGAQLSIGQVLELPITDAQIARFQKKRVAHLANRLDGYLKKKGGLVRVIEHRIRRNETVWSLARRNGRLPLWVISHYNKGLDLNALSIGDVIKIPITGAQTVSRR